MNTKTLSHADLRTAGIDALVQALGPVGMVRFLQQFETGHGDYTKERHALLGTGDVRSLAAVIIRERAENEE